MKHPNKESNYRKKMMFNTLLSKELGNCKYKIIAGYEWKDNHQIFSLRFLDNQTIQLKINLHFKEEKIFQGSENSKRLSLFYRAYFIVNYIHCLENTFTSFPDSYFLGLVSLCALNIVSSKKRIASFSPIIDSRPFTLKPIDVHCAIKALTVLTIEFENMISYDSARKCESAINKLFTYSLLPEIGYVRAHPIYCLLYELKFLHKIIKNNKLEDAPFLSEDSLLKFDHMTMDELIKNNTLMQNQFIAGAIIRLISYTENQRKGKFKYTDQLIGSIYQYKENNVQYFKDIQHESNELLKDNFFAIKRFNKKFNSVFDEVIVESGGLHYYC